MGVGYGKVAQMCQVANARELQAIWIEMRLPGPPPNAILGGPFTQRTLPFHYSPFSDYAHLAPSAALVDPD